jgi:hypothetical protein
MFEFDIRPLIILAGIGLIFGLWKIVEIVLWFLKHIQWN